MKIKRFASVMMAFLILALTVLPAGATTELDPVMLHSCNSIFGSFILEKGNCTEGTSSLRMNLTSTGSFACEYSIRQPLDLSDADTVALDIYLSDVSILQKFSQLYLELTSSGTCDHQEIAWILKSASQIPNDDNPGWVTVYLYFSEGNYTDGSPDLSAINYMRIFGFYDAAQVKNGDYFLVDNIRACTTGGPDYSSAGFDDYKLDNSDVTIQIVGQERPDLTRRDEEITISSGLLKADPLPSDPTTPDQPQNVDHSNRTVLYIVVSVCLVVLVLLVALLVTVKKKKKSTR